MTILNQKDVKGNERPISFMSIDLQRSKLNYLVIDKHAYVVYHAVKYFRPYLLKYHMIIFMPHPATRTLFVQQELGDKRENWMECYMI